MLMRDNVKHVVEDKEKTYFFTPASSGEVLYLRDYPQYTTVICDTTSYAGTVQLPSVAEARGMEFTIVLRTDGGNDITIADEDDSEDWSDLTAADANDTGTFKSDGTRWILVESTGLA
jgi:hypothetical protein